MSGAHLPTLFQWDGEAMRPAVPKLAASRYQVGESYLLAERKDRSRASHDHAFAWLGEAHASLPEHLAEQYPTPDHLRKDALIEAGFYDQTTVDAGSRAAALRVAAMMRSLPGEEFSRIVTRGGVVVRRTAKSMARGKMDRGEFALAKQAVLEHVAALLAVEPQLLERQREGA